MDTELQLATWYIETFAGNGKARSTGDGKRAVKAGIPLPHHAALDKSERWLYFAESGSDRIRRVDLQEGTLHNFAGRQVKSAFDLKGRGADLLVDVFNANGDSQGRNGRHEIALEPYAWRWFRVGAPDNTLDFSDLSGGRRDAPTARDPGKS